MGKNYAKEANRELAMREQTQEIMQAMKRENKRAEMAEARWTALRAFLDARDEAATKLYLVAIQQFDYGQKTERDAIRAKMDELEKEEP